MMVVTADAGGTFRETFALAKAYTDARKQHGASELLDELAAAGPKRSERFRSPDELREHGRQKLRDAAALLERKATPEETDDYRAFVATLTQRIGEAHHEHDEPVSDRERAAMDEVSSSLRADDA